MCQESVMEEVSPLSLVGRVHARQMPLLRHGQWRPQQAAGQNVLLCLHADLREDHRKKSPINFFNFSKKCPSVAQSDGAHMPGRWRIPFLTKVMRKERKKTLVFLKDFFLLI